MNFANAIRPKMKRHSTTNMTKLFVGVGRLSGTLAVGSIGPIVAWNSALALTRLGQTRWRRPGSFPSASAWSPYKEVLKANVPLASGEQGVTPQTANFALL